MSPSAPNHFSSPSGSWLDTRATPNEQASGTTSPVSSDLSAASPRTDAAGASTHDQWYYYLSPHAVKRLPHYEYDGADTSPFYAHVLSPFAGWCVERLTPRWVAPNAITLFGLSWMALSYSVVWYWCPGLYEANTDVGAVAPVYVAPESWFRTARSGTPPGSYAVPGAIFLLNGCAMLLYQTLDNMDGKQARRTGTCSPLGLLFDHGCDAFNLLLGSANWMAAMAMVPGRVSELVGRADHGSVQERSVISAFFGGDVVLATLLMLCPMVTFYITTWEHYHTHKLILPPVNGPSEGLALGATLSFLSFLWGPMYWQGTSLADGAIGSLASLVDFAALQGRVRNMDLVILLSVVGMAQEVVLKVLSVVRSHGLNTLRTTVPQLLLVAFLLALVLLDPTVFLRRPRVLLHLVNGLFTEQTTQLMLCHVVGERFRLRERWCLFPAVALAVLMACVPVEPASVDTLLLVYTSGLWVYLAFKIRVQLYEVCDVLGIWCFDIVTPYSKGLEEVAGTAVFGAPGPAVGGTAKKTN